MAVTSLWLETNLGFYAVLYFPTSVHFFISKFVFILRFSGFSCMEALSLPWVLTLSRESLLTLSRESLLPRVPCHLFSHGWLDAAVVLHSRCFVLLRRKTYLLLRRSQCNRRRKKEMKRFLLSILRYLVRRKIYIFRRKSIYVEKCFLQRWRQGRARGATAPPPSEASSLPVGGNFGFSSEEIWQNNAQKHYFSVILAPPPLSEAPAPLSENFWRHPWFLGS